jgi:hypothetical protein
MKLTSMLAASAVALVALNVAIAEDPPAPVADEAPGIQVGPGVPTSGPIELFACVKVEDRDNIHPCAVPMIVAIADPCNPCCCRYVQICVPPCGCPPKIETSRHGTKVEYDYGEYEVEIKSKKDYVVVNYDD